MDTERETEESILLDDSLDSSLVDPKENIGLQINDIEDDEELAPESAAELGGGKLIGQVDQKEASKPQVLLASWDL